MKFQVAFKTPDAIDEAIDYALQDFLEDSVSDLVAIDNGRNQLEAVVKPWVKWGEYLTVEFDTEAGTCVVVPAS